MDLHKRLLLVPETLKPWMVLESRNRLYAFLSLPVVDRKVPHGQSEKISHDIYWVVIPVRNQAQLTFAAPRPNFSTCSNVLSSSSFSADSGGIKAESEASGDSFVSSANRVLNVFKAVVVGNLTDGENASAGSMTANAMAVAATRLVTRFNMIFSKD